MLVLALSPAALAQSAGDQQYQDPFDEETGGGQQQAEPQEQQSEAPTTQGQTADPGATTTQAAPAQTGTLPRTGGPTPLLFAYGAVLLLGGVTLRRAVRSNT